MTACLAQQHTKWFDSCLPAPILGQQHSHASEERRDLPILARQLFTLGCQLDPDRETQAFGSFSAKFTQRIPNRHWNCAVTASHANANGRSSHSPKNIIHLTMEGTPNVVPRPRPRKGTLNSTGPPICMNAAVSCCDSLSTGSHVTTQMTKYTLSYKQQATIIKYSRNASPLLSEQNLNWNSKSI